MDQLLKAIIDEYNTADGPSGPFALLRAANTGGLFLELQKQNQAYPYIVTHHISSTFDYTMQAADNIKTGLVQFSMFSDTVNELMTVYDKFTTAFDDTTLNYTSDNALVCERSSETGPTQIEDYWMVTVDYNIMRNS